MTIRQFIKKLFVTIIMIGIVLAAVLKVGYILICKVIVVIIFVVLAIRYWVGEDIRKAEEEKRGTWLFTLGFIGLTVLTMLAANIPGQVQRDQYLYLTKEHTEQLEKVLLREATADSERCMCGGGGDFGVVLRARVRGVDELPGCGRGRCSGLRG